MIGFAKKISEWFGTSPPKKTEAPAVTQPPIEQKRVCVRPTFTIETMEDGQIFITCVWPKPANTKDAGRVAHALANSMYLLSTGELFSTLMQATAINGHELKMNEVAGAACEMAHRAMMTKAAIENDSKLVVPPEEALKP